MPKQTMCADNLFLVGELLQGAGEYLTRSRDQAEDEDRFMIELAREQIPHLRLALRNMERSLAELDRHLKSRLGPGEGKTAVDKEEQSLKKTERRYKKASSSG
jgi:hypothetical protein